MGQQVLEQSRKPETSRDGRAEVRAADRRVLQLDFLRGFATLLVLGNHILLNVLWSTAAQEQT